MDQQVYFSSKLAEVIFGDVPRGAGPLVAEEAVGKFEMWMMGLPTQTSEQRARVQILAGYIDRELVSKLPGAHQLRMARVIESKIPELVKRMPTLSYREKHLRKSNDLAQVFMPDSLDRLAEAIRKDGD